MDRVLSELSRPRRQPVSGVCVCQCCVCARICACVNVCLQAFVCVKRRRRSHSSGLWSDLLPNRWAEREGGGFLLFSSFAHCFICFDSSPDIYVTLFLKFHNTLLEVWVEGKGCGMRQDTKLWRQLRLSPSHLPPSLLGGGESVTTERHFGDSQRFHHHQEACVWTQLIHA